MEDFLKEALETRKAFAQAVIKSPWDTQARTKADDLLIMYDQMMDLIGKFSGIYADIYDNAVGENDEGVAYTFAVLKKIIVKFQTEIPELKNHP